jgi:hypothetical protein
VPKPDPKPSVRTSALRSSVEHRSHGLARRLESLPAAAPMVGALVLVVAGALVRGVVGAICFGILTAFLAWLLFLAWPRLTPLERLMRGSLLLLTAVVTLVLAIPR